MRIVFNRASKDVGTLKVLTEIPDLRMARIEGRNGIGKTVAARLLEIVSGQTPFAALPLAWLSLVDTLGQIDIEISGLGASVATIQLDSSSWTGRTQQDCAHMPGRAFLDGHEVGWDELRRLLQVRRIAGDEGLAETLGRTLRERAVEADAIQKVISPIVDSWSHQIADLRNLINRVTPEALQSSRARLDLARENHARAMIVSNDRAQRLELARFAHLRLNQMSKVAQELPELLVSYDLKRSQYDEYLSRTAKLEEALRAQGADSAKTEAQKQILAGWHRKLRLRESALARARVEEQQVLRALGLFERPSEVEISEMARQVNAQIIDAERSLKSIDMAGTVRDAAAQLEDVLDELPQEAADENIAEINGPVSVALLRSGISSRKHDLEKIPKPGEAVQIESRIRQMGTRQLLLQRLPQYISATDRKRANVSEAENEINKLLSLTPAALHEQEGTIKEISALRTDLLATSNEILTTVRLIYKTMGVENDLRNGFEVDATERLSGVGDDLSEASAADESGEDDDIDDNSDVSVMEGMLQSREILESFIHEWVERAAADLSGNVGTLGLELSGLSWPLESKREELILAAAEAQARLTEALQAEQQAARDLGAAEAEVKIERSDYSNLRQTLTQALAALAFGLDDWPKVKAAALGAMAQIALPDEPGGGARWVDREFIELALDSGLPEGIQLEVAGVLARLTEACDHIEDAATRTRDAYGTISAYLNEATQRLAPRLSDGSAAVGIGYRGSAPFLKQWAETELATLLGTPALRRELFEGASRVIFDLNALAVEWTNSQGKKRRRPLEAFSSGEQVFAYTRAKLENLAPIKESARFVLVFLDEFGAFVARDRFSQLMQYVQSEALGIWADQIVVMLPLSSEDVDSAWRLGGHGERMPAIKTPDFFAVSIESSLPESSS